MIPDQILDQIILCTPNNTLVYDALCELREARKIIGLLPRTKDGVIMPYKQNVYPPCGCYEIAVEYRFGCHELACFNKHPQQSLYFVHDCYSTREAALAARPKE